MLASTPDLLRLLAVPVFGYVAYRDVKTRRVPNRTWVPLAALALVLLAWDGYAAYAGGDRLFFLRAAIGVGFVVPLVTAFWYTGSFGGADAKAFYVLALLFPVYPVYYPPDLPLVPATLPMEPSPAGLFSLTILSNTVVAGAVYPLGVALVNLLRGNVGLPMVIGRPLRWDRLPEEYGVLLETPDGFTRRGLDLDALRMYLAWRGCSIADLREAPETHRDPASLPAEPNPPGDGVVADGGLVGDQASSDRRSDGGQPVEDGAEAVGPDAAPADDPWGAEAFLDDVEGSAYGTTPERLREGLEVVVDEEEVWISPGIPFLVPTFAGLLVSLTYGDLLFQVVAAL
ncbi:A24 family peptidase [Halomicrobium salinisoli]|uniref:A24 family peptidase n=1 Tax=Halomicrobium salinisoli TaxID=2878391 RepID=UPI001CF09F15|nr:A24 family peptidase [Halomicrobium salinisoli]